jgi:hypothetical protein
MHITLPRARLGRMDAPLRPVGVAFASLDPAGDGVDELLTFDHIEHREAHALLSGKECAS